MRHGIALAFGALGLGLLAPVGAYGVYDLSCASWTVSDPGKNVSVPGRLPSQVHLDLHAAGVIPDPYYGLGDFELRWVTYSNWTYSARLPKSVHDPDADHHHGGSDQHGADAKGTSTWLVFDGLDTFTSISLCGKHVAATNNQFRQYSFDVTRILGACSCEEPELSINFGSAVNISAAIAAQPGQHTWQYPLQGTFEFPNRWFIRKEQSDFGWDWGPAFAPAGPWLPARVVTLRKGDVYIRNTLVDIYREGQRPLIPPDQSKHWIVNVSIDYLGELPRHASLRYRLKDAKGKVVAKGKLSNVTTTSKGVIGGSTVINPKDVHLWWPAGMGKQVLYDMDIEIDGSSNKASVTKRVGFRTIVQNAFPITDEQLAQGIAPGNNWHFEINGHTFYAKGSNFIPPDAFWARVTPSRIRQLFESVVLGNQNMLRVWSSGAYSPDFMYDLADEMGILLWSEFEFGDALYPVDDEFIANVKEEVTYQVRRVNHHPSLAFWAGGNELENLELTLASVVDPDNYFKLLAEYEYLFLDTIVPILFGNSRSISYAPSSTSNGWLSLNYSRAQPITERYNNKTEGSIYGETDYYNYNSSFAFDIRSYPVGRFSNEFGYHSMPSLHSWRAAVDESDLHFNSTTIQLRNHHYPAGGPFTDNFANTTKGMAEMTVAVERWLPPPSHSDSVANFSAWCHATQLFQAAFYTSQIHFYRRGSGMPERQLGSLYWQLEDIWQAPTWAGIEYDGRWKVLHYAARDVYKPVVVAPFHNLSSDALEVYVTSDRWHSVKGTARLSWLDWSGEELRPTQEIDFTVGAINTTRVYAANLTRTLKQLGKDAEDVVLRMEIASSSGDNETYTHVNWFNAAPLSRANLEDPGLKWEWTKSADGDEAVLTVEATKAVSAWTWIDPPEGVVVALSENGFWLGRGEKKTVRVEKVWKDETRGRWRRGVSVESAWDLNHE